MSITRTAIVLDELYSLPACYDTGVEAWLRTMLARKLDILACIEAHWSTTDEDHKEAIAAALGISGPDIELTATWNNMPAMLRGQYEAIGEFIADCIR